ISFSYTTLFRSQEKSATTWVEEFRELGIPCSEIFSIAQGVEFANEIGLEPIQPTGVQKIPTIKHPIDYSRSHVTYDKAPPKLHEDAQEILSWISSVRRARLVREADLSGTEGRRKL